MNAETKLQALREIRATLQVGITDAEAAFKAAEQAYQQAGQTLGEQRAGAKAIDGQLKRLEAEVGQAHAAALAEPATAPQTTLDDWNRQADASEEKTE